MTQGPAANLLASLKRMVGTLAAMAETRLELLVVEFEEERALTVDHWWQPIYRYRLIFAVAAGFGVVVGVRKRRALLPWLRRGWFAWGLLRSVRAARH